MIEKNIEPLGHVLVIGRQLILAEDPTWLRCENSVKVDLDSVFYEDRPQLADSDLLFRLREAIRPRPKRKTVASLRGLAQDLTPTSLLVAA